MRYLFGLMCMLALGVMPMVGCSETTGDGGSGGTGGTAGSGGMGGEGGTGGQAGDCRGGYLGSGVVCPCTAVCDLDTGLCDESTNAPQDTPCGGGICDGAGRCVECYADEQCSDDFNDCTVSGCDIAEGECFLVPVANETPCAGGACQAGVCELSGSVLPCSEQGIRNAIAAGGDEPYTIDCDGTTPGVKGAEIIIDNDVILDGEGKLTVAADGGDPDHRVFRVPGGVAAELRGFTVTEGGPDEGGGFLNLGRLSLTSVTVSGNSAGGQLGGGILNQGTLTLTNSTVSGNSSTYPGRGTGGGGIHNDNSGTMTLMNSTVSGNTGGGIRSDGTMTLTNSTVSGDGISSREGVVMLANSVVDGACDGNITSNGYNIESPGNTCGFDQEGDQPSVTEEDLNLGELANNSGPTMTHLPGGGDFGEDSAAIDKIPGDSCDVTDDQRGQPRPETGGTMCDVGSVEVQS